MSKIEIKRIQYGDVTTLSKKQSVKLYLKSHKEIADDIEAQSSHFTYWISSVPHCLIITRDLTTTQPEHMTPWIEEEKQSWWIDLIFLSGHDLDKGVEALRHFGATLAPEVGALLTDPEVKNETHLSLYEQAGFVRVSTFIKGQGFFKGSPHYILKLKLSTL